MAQSGNEIDVAWIPTAEALRGTTQEGLLIQAFLQYRHWLRDQKETAVQARALEKIAEVSQNAPGPISCTAGCAACCHARVDVSKHEKRLILAHLKKTPQSVDMERLRVQAQALRAGTWNELPFATRRCVFLDDANRCSIYESRPLLCRRYLVTSDRSHCDTENWSGISRVMNADADGFLSAVFTKFKFEPLVLFLEDNVKSLSPG